MKKQLFIMNNQKGFFLPYTLLICAVVIVVTVTNVTNYKQEIHVTDHYLNQIIVETMIQMGRMKFKDEIDTHHKDTDEIEYTFPDGKIKITYHKLTEVEYALHFTVFIDDSTYVITNSLMIY